MVTNIKLTYNFIAEIYDGVINKHSQAYYIHTDIKSEEALL